MSKILALIDDSSAARPVLATALVLAPILGAAVEAVHIRSDSDGRTASAECLGVNIVAQAASDDVVAVAIGAGGLPTRNRPAGHLALQVASAIDKPVIVVPPDAPPHDRILRVLIAVEGRPGKGKDIKRAVELVSAADLELIALHVDDETSIPYFSDQVGHETDAFTREFLARHLPGAPTVRLELRIGLPADEILATAADANVDIIALGWPQSAHRGAVTREVVARSRLPVFLVATT